MRASIYARVSTEKQEKQETVNSQLEALRDYAKKNNYTIHEEYVDEGYSGELLDRPALDRLRDDVKKKLFEVVLVYSPDRLSRDFINLGLIKREINKLGINIVFLNRPESKNTPADILFANMEGSIAEYEKALILDRTRRGKMHKVKSGILVGSIAPYGYRYILGDKSRGVVGHYELVNEEAKVVKLIFDLFVNRHLSIRAIARELTAKDIPPRKGKYWRTSSIHRIIRNETYTGITYYNKHISVETDNHKNGNKYRRAKNTGRRLRPKDQWAPITLPENLKIIDKNTFDLAQKQLIRNAEMSPRNVKHEYLLRGLVKCGNCDAPFYGTTCHGKLYYRCGNRHRTFPLPKECKVDMVKAVDLDSVVWDKVCEAIKNPRLITEQITKLKEKEARNKTNIPKDIALIETDISKTLNEENRLLEAYRGGAITIEQLKDQMAMVQDKKKQFEKDKQDLLARQDSSFSVVAAKKTINEYCKTLENRLDSLKNDFEGKRYFLSLAINKIVLDDNKVRIKGIIPAYPQENLTPIGNIAYITP